MSTSVLSLIRIIYMQSEMPTRTFITNKRYYLALASVVIIGCFARIHQLGSDDLWIDEAFTGFLALTHDWLTYLRSDNTPPLYYLLMRLWCGIVPCGEFSLRLPSALAGTAFIALVATFSRQVFGRVPALLVALITTLSPIHIYYSQEARVYSILLVTLLLFLYLQWRNIHRKETPGLLVLLFTVGACVLYLHYLSLVVISVCFVLYLVQSVSRHRRIPLGYFAAVGGSILVFIPWLMIGILSDHSTSSELSWIAKYSSDKSLWQQPVRTLTTFLAGPVAHTEELELILKRNSAMEVPAVLYLVNGLLTLLFVCLYATALTGARSLSEEMRSAFFEMSAFTILPLFAVLVASVLVAPMYVVGRYDLIALPAFLLATAGVAAVAMNRATLRSVTVIRAALGILVVSLLGTQAYRVISYKDTDPHKLLIKTDMAVATGQIGNSDGLLVATPQAVHVWYYLHRMGFDRKDDQCIGDRKRFTCRLFPRAMEQAPASMERFPGLYDDKVPSFDLDYFVDGLVTDAKIILLLDDLTSADGSVTLDRIGGGIAKRLMTSGYSIHDVVSEHNYLVFAGNTAGG